MIVNARMYSVAPAAKAAWRELLEWVIERAQVRMEFVDQEPPATLSDLWARTDLGCAMMCGLPYSHRSPRPILLAAPVPSPARYANRAVYFTDIVVRADAPFQSVEQTFGHVVGYTLTDSMSGCVALRRYLLPHRKPGSTPLYRKVVGELVNARGIIQALIERRIDVGPLDGYVHDLIRHNDPEFAANVRIIAVTDAAPMPPLIATAALDCDTLGRLRSAFAAVEEAPELARVRDALLLRRFALPEPSSYDVFGDILASSEQHAGVW
ncbi:MAG: PhnD/SsuA/transferrin family substrate-binding protein [Betaproteobacteria bacterium]